MEDTGRERELADRFEQCSKILTAIGDETRQHLMVEMMKMGQCSIGIDIGHNQKEADSYGTYGSDQEAAFCPLLFRQGNRAGEKAGAYGEDRGD